MDILLIVYLWSACLTAKIYGLYLELVALYGGGIYIDNSVEYT